MTVRTMKCQGWMKLGLITLLVLAWLAKADLRLSGGT